MLELLCWIKVVGANKLLYSNITGLSKLQLLYTSGYVPELFTIVPVGKCALQQLLCSVHSGFRVLELILEEFQISRIRSTVICMNRWIEVSMSTSNFWLLRSTTTLSLTMSIDILASVIQESFPEVPVKQLKPYNNYIAYLLHNSAYITITFIVL